MSPLRLLIADDHPAFRRGLRAILSAVPDIEVVGEATSGDEAVALARTQQPDVVLMDLHMPGGGGLTATRAILAENPQRRVLMLTMFEDETSLFLALRAGARGYILKETNEDEIVHALRVVAEGGAIFSPSIAQRMMDFFATQRPAAPKEAFPTLTEREREILHLLARGHTNTQVADVLSLTGKTVSNYLSSIFSKLQVADRAEAILKAREAGL